MALALQQLIEQSLSGLGYELVEFEFAGRGLLRIYIDRPFVASQEPTNPLDSLITVEDCEVVSRQLSRVFEVEAVGYERLEISSPGIDRLLTRETDYHRFAGELVVVKLQLPLAGRKNFEGVLVVEPPDETGVARFGVDYDDEKKGQSLRMNFVLADVDKTRLVPIVDFNRSKNATKKATA
jgi:ribosome maturation factor RimP